jgi:hypothetical protein
MFWASASLITYEEGRVNARTHSLALYAIGIIAVLASADALAHSYTGLYGWALHHMLSGLGKR